MSLTSISYDSNGIDTEIDTYDYSYRETLILPNNTLNSENSTMNKDLEQNLSHSEFQPLGQIASQDDESDLNKINTIDIPIENIDSAEISDSDRIGDLNNPEDIEALPNVLPEFQPNLNLLAENQLEEHIVEESSGSNFSTKIFIFFAFFGYLFYRYYKRNKNSNSKFKKMKISTAKTPENILSQVKNTSFRAGIQIKDKFKTIFSSLSKKKRKDSSTHYQNSLEMQTFSSNLSPSSYSRSSSRVLNSPSSRSRQLFNSMPRLIYPKLHKPLLTKVFNDLISLLSKGDKSQHLFLCFSSVLDGYNLNTLYNRVKAQNIRDQCYSILLIKDTGGYIFGAYLSHSLKLKGNSYFGDGSCFLFTLNPKITIYKWSKINRHFINTSQEYLVLGENAIYLDHTLSRCISRSSATFNSPSLSKSEVFNCQIVEYWYFKTPF